MFRKFCSARGLYTSDGGQTTHLLMDGGRLCVPDAVLVQFYKEYIRCINAGEKIPLVERLGPACLMRFFLDVDKTDVIDDIIEVASDLVGQTPRVFVSTGGGGYHIVFNAPHTMDACVDLCRRVKGRLPPGRRHVVDETVYRSGLRMIYADKYANGRYLDRWYVPLNHSKHDLLTSEMLRHSIVRIRTVGPPARPVSACPVPDIVRHMGRIHRSYAGARVKGARMINGRMCISVDSKYCTNVGRDHTGNHIYFVINRKLELYQKCHSTNMKSAGRIHCYCHQYRSAPVRLPATYATIFATSGTPAQLAGP